MCYTYSMDTIKSFLEVNGMTQAELADKLGYNEAYISMIISGKRTPKDAFRWRWLQTFGLPLEDENGTGGDDAN